MSSANINLKEYLEASSLYVMKEKLLINESEETAYFYLKDYILTSSSEHIARYGMEYLARNGLYQELQMLMEKNKQSSNILNKQWAAVYEWLFKRRFKKIAPEQLEINMEAIDTNDPALLALLTFLRLYIAYDIKKFGELGNYLDVLDEHISNVKSPFMRELLEARKQEMLFHYHWKRNEVVIARKYGFQILTQTTNYYSKCNMHINLGHTYLYESYEKAMKYLIQAKIIADKYGYTTQANMITNNSIPFVAAFHKKTVGVKTDDLMEKAHLLIAKGEYQSAKDILTELNSNSPFYKLYVGMVNRDQRLLKESFNQFINEESDYFYAKLPIMEMDKLKIVH